MLWQHKSTKMQYKFHINLSHEITSEKVNEISDLASPLGFRYKILVDDEFYWLAVGFCFFSEIDRDAFILATGHLLGNYSKSERLTGYN